AREDERDLGAEVRAEPLLAAQVPAPILLDGPRLVRADVGAALALGEPHGALEDGRLARAEARDVAGREVLRAEAFDDARGAVGHADRAEEAGLGHAEEVP